MSSIAGPSHGETGFPLEELRRLLARDEPCLQLEGLPGPALAYLLSQLPPPPDGSPRLVLTPDAASAETLARDLRFFLPEGEASTEDEALAWGAGSVLELPVLDVSPYSGLSPDRRRVLARLRALAVLAEPSLRPRPRYVISAADNLLRRVIPKSTLLDRTLWLAAGEAYERDGLARHLAGLGYTRVQTVEEPGCYSVRGGTVDVFSPLYRWPLRLEFWDDELEGLRFFDPDGQRSLYACDVALLPPAREEITLGEHLALARERILELAAAQDLPSSRARQVLGDLASGIYFFGVEALLPAFHQRLGSLGDYLPLGVHRVLVDPAGIRARLEELHERATVAWEGRFGSGDLIFPPAEHFLDPQQAASVLEAEGRLEVGGLQGPPRARCQRLRFRCFDQTELVQELRAAQASEGGLAPFVQAVHRWLDEGQRVGLVVASAGRAERVRELLKQHGFRVSVLDAEGLQSRGPGDDDLKPGALRIVRGGLSGGLLLPAHNMVLVTDGEVFGERAPRRARRHRKPTEGLLAAFQELSPGDLVVHQDHGVGCYRELVKLAVGGVENDYLLIEYKGGDKLYLPVQRLDHIHRYVGAGVQEGPALDRLGGSTWQRTSRKVRKGVEQLALKLLELQATRKAADGLRFSPPDTLYREFEARFPFEETPDQEAAIESVIDAMLAPGCMDHLVCGDVGYGKTEVAMRAAFLAVESGYQVAVLCPTTVLATQHLATFRERFQGFPITVEGLSRTTPPKDLSRILKDTAAGRVDVLVGTHRILSQDVTFQRLGLVVVDEEQRFGVKQKERLKELRAEVDVLTLTATPIPRTLNMALSGLKEISVIATPPLDRQSIRTFVTQYEPQTLRQAILQELARGGQVFYVHNRVRSLGEVKQKLEQLVPEARIGVAHGQMPAAEAESAMLRFMRQEDNILLCTAIIESGLDISRANTMIVEDAHMFGLAQLYQLRGRIGRSRERAFAYLLVPPQRQMTDQAIQRLEALQRFTELGAGFQIASLDLEIRGAGDLLGPDQSGSLEAVGFEMYTRMLEEAVQQLSGERRAPEVEPELKLPVTALIPQRYLPDTSLRLGFYKRLSRARDLEEVGGLFEEMVDRFGSPPPELQTLFQVMQIKALARQAGIPLVEWKGGRGVFELGAEPQVDPGRVMELLEQPKSPWRLSPQMQLSVAAAGEPEAALPQIREALLELVGHARDGHAA